MISYTTSDGKYTFEIPDNDYRVHVRRHGEPWLVIEAAHKAIGTLLSDIEEKDTEISRLAAELRKLNDAFRNGTPTVSRGVK